MKFLDFLKKLFRGEEPPTTPDKHEESVSLSDTNIKEMADGSKVFIPPSLNKK